MHYDIVGQARTEEGREESFTVHHAFPSSEEAFAWGEEHLSQHQGVICWMVRRVPTTYLAGGYIYAPYMPKLHIPPMLLDDFLRGSAERLYSGRG